jgi:nucleoside-diphosphate-sugar epimerase
MKVLVTGASGFIGQSLVPYLLASGHEVIGCARNLKSLDLFTGKTSFRAAEVGELEAMDWEPLLQDVDAVVHLAARVHVMNDTHDSVLDLYRAVNVKGTKRLAEACLACGVRRFIYLSSIKVNGEETSNGPFSEEDGPLPKDPYGISKWEAEKALKEISEKSNLEVGILRPPLIYGPGVRANFYSLLKAIDKSWPLPIGSITQNRRSLLYVENLATAIEKVMILAGLKFEIFLVADDESLSTVELARLMKRALGSKSVFLKIPVVALKRLAKWVHKEPQIDRLTGSLEVSNQKLKTLAKWRPSHTSESGVDLTVRWFQGKTTSRAAPNQQMPKNVS